MQRKQQTARKLLEAFPYDTAPRFLLRDNDPKFGAEFKRCIDSLAIAPHILVFEHLRGRAIAVNECENTNNNTGTSKPVAKPFGGGHRERGSPCRIC